MARFRGYPKAIRTDQGPEFTGKALDQWAYQRDIKLKLIQPGKPTQNAFIESFNGKFRDECLNEHWFCSLAEARIRIAAWRRDYNEHRPHSAIGNLTPAEFAASWRTRQQQLIAERGLKLVADEANSSKGRIAANGSLHAKVGTLSQKGGELTSQDSLTLDLGILNNNAGRIAGNQGVDITARQVDNSIGEIASQGVVALNLTEQLDNRGGKIVGDSGLGITAPHGRRSG